MVRFDSPAVLTHAQFRLFDAVCANRHEELARLLREDASLINVGHPERGHTLATLAAELDRAESLAVLAEFGADFIQVDAMGRDPIAAAAAADSVEALNFLFTRPEINPDAIAPGAANTPLEIAARRGQVRAVRALLGRAARDANQKINGRAIFLACMNNQPASVRELVLHSDLTYTNNQRWDALDACVRLKRADCADALAARMGRARTRQAITAFGPGRMPLTARFFELSAMSESALQARGA